VVIHFVKVCFIKLNESEFGPRF